MPNVEPVKARAFLAFGLIAGLPTGKFLYIPKYT